MGYGVDEPRSGILDAMTTTDTLEWTLGDRLAKARRRHGWNQAEMADRLGISRRSISRYEEDHARPSRAVLIAWAQVTDTPLAWLEGGELSVTRSHTLRTPTRRRVSSLLMDGFRHPSAFIPAAA